LPQVGSEAVVAAALIVAEAPHVLVDTGASAGTNTSPVVAWN